VSHSGVKNAGIDGTEWGKMAPWRPREVEPLSLSLCRPPSRWCRRGGSGSDGSAAQGMPAHITALSPFLPEGRLTDEVLARLRELCAGLPVLDVEFRRTARFPDVLISTRNLRTDCGRSPSPSLGSGRRHRHTAAASAR
jgi:hypothetical protein